nr:hypothetical protein [Tanacetum cinerariifolium]
MEEEDIRALKRLSESQEDKAAKKQKLDEEVAMIKRHLQKVPNDEDDVYTEATPLARKVLVVDYKIYTEKNKPYYKIIRADGSPQLFLGFLSLLRNFNREDLEVLWGLVKEIFASSKSKNFSDDFLLTTLTYIFEKPHVQAQVWKNQRIVHGLAKNKVLLLAQDEEILLSVKVVKKVAKSNLDSDSSIRPNGEALKKCILSGPYKPTTVLVHAVESTDDSPAVPEHTT